MTPLSHEHEEELRRCGERLAGELHRLFEAISPKGRTVREVAAALSIDRNIAQRALAAAQPPVDGVLVFIKMPGVRSLRQLVESARKVRKCQSVAASLEAAILDAEHQIVSIGGHQARLRTMIKSRGSPSTEHVTDMLSPTMRARMHAYQGAVDVAGSHCELNYSLRIHRITPNDRSTSQCATIKALIGQRSRPGGMTSTISGMRIFGREKPIPVPENWSAPLGEGGVGQAGPEAILHEYSTTNVPWTCVNEHRQSEVHVVEPSATHAPAGVDIVTARTHFGMPNLMLPPDQELTHITHVILPTKRLLLDVFLHKDMAAKATASFGGFIWTPEVERDIQSAWFHRLRGTPPLATLGRGLRHIDTDAWSRHSELTRSTFERLGWDPGDFVGFRGDVMFPTWGAKYAVIFGFESLQVSVGQDGM